MKNVIKKIASIALAFTLLGTGTSVTKTISPDSNNTIAASKIKSVGIGKQIGQVGNEGRVVQGMGMYNNTFYFITEKNDSNCKLFRMDINEKKAHEIGLSKSDRQLIAHGNDLCVAKCNGKICLFVVNGEKKNSDLLLMFELDSKQENAALVEQYKFNHTLSAVTLVNPDGNKPLEFIFRCGKDIYSAKIERQMSKEKQDMRAYMKAYKKPVSRQATKIHTIYLNEEIQKEFDIYKNNKDKQPKYQGICYFNGLLIVPYTFGNLRKNYIQIYNMEEGFYLYPIDSFKSEKSNTKFEIESIDYSNGNNWYYNTNENGYFRFYRNTSLGDEINIIRDQLAQKKYYDEIYRDIMMSKR